MAGEIQPVRNVTKLAAQRPVMAASAVNTMTPKEIVAILRRHVLLIIILTVLGTIAGGAGFFLLARFAPKFTAQTAINVLPPGLNDPMKIGEAQTNKDIYFQFRSTKAAYIKQQNTLLDLIKKDVIRETDWYKQFNNNIPDIIEDLEDNLRASPSRDMDWIVISMTCGSKKESALIVNTMVDLFIKAQYEDATRDISKQLEERQKQRDGLKRELDNHNRALDGIRATTSFGNLDKTRFRSYLDDNLEDLSTRSNQLSTDISRLESQIEILRVRATGDFDAVVRERVERDPIASQMRSNITSLEINLATVLTKFGENHAEVQRARDALRQAKADLAKRQSEIAQIETSSDLRNAEDAKISFMAELDALVKQRQEAEADYKRLDDIRATYEKTVTLRDEAQEALQKINDHIQSLKLLHDEPLVSKVSSVGAAPEPLQMSSPRLIVYVPAGIILGFLLGVGLAFAIELLNDILRTPSDVMKNIRAPLLGMICHADDDEQVDDIELPHVVRKAPFSMMSECYRQFRVNLKMSGSGEHKVFFVTSGAAGEGKTSVAANMANTLIAEGLKVLFIDTNFRRPCTTKLFPVGKTENSGLEHADAGLSNYLMGQCTIENIIRSSGIAGLDIIDSGPLPSHPGELLGSSQMQDLLTAGRQRYDYVVIDGPPLLVSDAKLLAMIADGTILVLNATLTRRGAAQRAMRELREINANVVGTVLLAVRSLKGGYFREMYRSYQEYQKVKVPQPV